MKAVKAHVTGNKDNIYIDPCTNTAFIDPTKANSKEGSASNEKRA